MTPYERSTANLLLGFWGFVALAYVLLTGPYR